MTSLGSSIPTGSEVQNIDAAVGIPTTLPFGETDEIAALYRTGADTAEQAGATAHNPLKLLVYAQSALARDTSAQSTADLCYALREIKGVVTVSKPSPTAVILQSLTVKDTRTFLWGSFELCCAYLSRTDILEGYPVIALDVAVTLHEIMCHFHSQSSSAHYSRRSLEFSKCLEPVWSNLWTSRAILLSPTAVLDMMRWYIGARLLHLWAILSSHFDCLPAWGTSDAFWLLWFLLINQPNNAAEDPALLLHSIKMLECIGSKPSTHLPGDAGHIRICTIVDQLLATYGEDALLRRYNEALSHSTIKAEHQNQVQIHVYVYGGVPSLCSRLWGRGTVATYLQSQRRRQEAGKWHIYDADLLFDLLVKVAQAQSRDLPPHHIVSALITEEHLMRGFLLPALWLSVEKFCNPNKETMDTVGISEINMLGLVTKAVTRHRSARKGSVGHAVMATLSAEVSPYWHLMNDTILAAKPREPTCITRKEELYRFWQHFGEALQLNRKRAPRQIEGPAPTLQLSCSWPLCVYHSQKPPLALKSCKGCGEVQYCGKQCQLSDWKINDHKTRCRRLKE